MEHVKQIKVDFADSLFLTDATEWRECAPRAYAELCRVAEGALDTVVLVSNPSECDRVAGLIIRREADKLHAVGDLTACWASERKLLARARVAPRQRAAFREALPRQGADSEPAVTIPCDATADSVSGLLLALAEQEQQLKRTASQTWQSLLMRFSSTAVA